MRTRTALRLIGLVAAGLLLMAAGPVRIDPLPDGASGPSAEPTSRPAWRAYCPEGTVNAGEQFCTVTARSGMLDNRGVRRRVDVILHVDAHCTSLHVELPTMLDGERPAWMQVDGGALMPFYRPTELRVLADALDARTPPRDPIAPELASFWREAQAGVLGGHEDATAELVARFARLKQERTLGIGCETTARLLPTLLAGSELRLGFYAAPKGLTQPYHWAARDWREVLVRLDDLHPVLDSLPSLR